MKIIFKLTFVHRESFDKVSVFFGSYADACRYGRSILQFRSLLLGYDIREMKLSPDDGAFRPGRVLYKISWP